MSTATETVAGRFGAYGGRYVPETLMAALEELEHAYAEAQADPLFHAELDSLLTDYAGRPTPLYLASRLTSQLGGAKIYLKREDLLLDLLTNHAMKVAHHGGIGMSAENTAQQVVGGAHIGDPVAHGFVNRILQGAGSGRDAAHLRPEQAHTVDVELLALHVFLSHVDNALHPEEGTHGCGGHTVLPGAGFGDDAMLAHASR
jgi:hypothetical protein